MVKRFRPPIPNDVPEHLPFVSPLDDNKLIRAALITRLLKATERVPVALLHQIVTMLEEGHEW